MAEDLKNSLKKADKTFEAPLRPATLFEFIGQKRLCKQLDILIGAAKKRSDPLGHLLFSGPPGLGKTTLANIISKAMGTNLTSTSGPTLEKAGDLAGILTNLKEGDILFIDEIHRLAKCIEEYLYPAMEDFNLDLLIDSGPNARSVQVKLNRFTLIGATTRAGLISNPMRSRFTFSARLNYYEPDSMKAIVKRSSAILGIDIDNDGAEIISKRARGTPRVANNLLRWVRDYSEMHQRKKIDKDLAKSALEMLSIDHLGLDEMDKKILSVIINDHSGGPVGVDTIAVAVGEEKTTIQDVYEPYLIMMGFLRRTKRGREATELAKKHMETFIQRRLTNESV